MRLHHLRSGVPRPPRWLVGVAVIVVLGVGGTVAIFAATGTGDRAPRVHLALAPPSRTLTAVKATAPAGESSTTASSTTTSIGAPGSVTSAAPVSPSTTMPGVRWLQAALEVPGRSPAAGLFAIAKVPGEGFVAVGAADDGPLVAGSADGTQWARLNPRRDPFEGAQLRDVAVTTDAVVVVGAAGGRPAAWRSSDGVEWDAVKVGEAQSGFLDAVTVDRDLGVVAAGFSPPTSGIWRLEGGTFRAVAPPPTTDDEGRMFTGVTATGGAVVAVGNDGAGRAVAWTWRGGDRWVTAALGSSASASAGAVVGSGVVVVGYDGGGARAWRSGDGRSWATAATLAGDGATVVAPLALAAGPGGVLAVGQDGTSPLCWGAVPDGRWRRCAAPGFSAIARDVVADGDRFLVVGRVEGPGAGPAAWVVETKEAERGGQS